MKIIYNKDIHENEESDCNLENIIVLIENEMFESAKNQLDILISKNEYYSDAYVFRFLVCMHLKNYKCAAKDFRYAFAIEKHMKLVKPKYFMADIVKEYWFNSSNENRVGLRNELELLMINLKIV